MWIFILKVAIIVYVFVYYVDNYRKEIVVTIDVYQDFSLFKYIYVC